MKKIYFQEEQRFSQIWIWIFLIITFSLASEVIVGSILLGESVDNSSFSNETIVLIFIVAFSAVFWFLLKMKLEVKVTDEGIVYRFFPLMLKEKMVKRNIIESYEIRKYRPILDYGGYGFKVGLNKWGKAFNMKGNIGLQLYLKDGKKILFGTQRAEAFKYAIDKMMGNN
jgi:hypothetical protein